MSGVNIDQLLGIDSGFKFIAGEYVNDSGVTKNYSSRRWYTPTIDTPVRTLHSGASNHHGVAVDSGRSWHQNGQDHPAYRMSLYK